MVTNVHAKEVVWWVELKHRGELADLSQLLDEFGGNLQKELAHKLCIINRITRDGSTKIHH